MYIVLVVVLVVIVVGRTIVMIAIARPAPPEAAIAPATRLQTPPRQKAGRGKGGHLSQRSNRPDVNEADHDDDDRDDD